MEKLKFEEKKNKKGKNTPQRDFSTDATLASFVEVEVERAIRNL